MSDDATEQVLVAEQEDSIDEEPLFKATERSGDPIQREDEPKVDSPREEPANPQVAIPVLQLDNSEPPVHHANGDSSVFNVEDDEHGDVVVEAAPSTSLWKSGLTPRSSQPETSSSSSAADLSEIDRLRQELEEARAQVDRLQLEANKKDTEIADHLATISKLSQASTAAKKAPSSATTSSTPSKPGTKTTTAKSSTSTTTATVKATSSTPGKKPVAKPTATSSVAKPTATSSVSKTTAATSKPVGPSNAPIKPVASSSTASSSTPIKPAARTIKTPNTAKATTPTKTSTPAKATSPAPKPVTKTTAAKPAASAKATASPSTKKAGSATD